MRWTKSQLKKKQKASPEEVTAVEKFLERQGATILNSGKFQRIVKMSMPGLRSLGAIDFLKNYCSKQGRYYVWVRD